MKKEFKGETGKILLIVSIGSHWKLFLPKLHNCNIVVYTTLKYPPVGELNIVEVAILNRFTLSFLWWSITFDIPGTEYFERPLEREKANYHESH